MNNRVNAELGKVYDWLCVNKLSLNVSKTKCMIFRSKKVSSCVFPVSFEIDGESIEIVEDFNFLGITLDSTLTWTSHHKKVISKISQSLGVIKKVKKILPVPALKTLYSSLILTHLTYGIKLWGVSCDSVTLIQKRAIRVITNSKYLAHTSPLFKSQKLLKLPDLHNFQCLAFHYKIENKLVPEYFKNFTIHNWNIHNHFTRGRNNLRPTGVKSNWIRHTLPDLVINSPNEILSLIPTVRLETFKAHVKEYYINAYQTECREPVCLPCGRGQFL